MNKSDNFISIKQAIEATGKSDSTIRRILKNLSSQELSQYTAKEGRKIYLSKEWIYSRLGKKDHLAEYQEYQNTPNNKSLAVINQLTMQIDRFDQEREQWNEERMNLLKERMVLHKERQELEKTLNVAMNEILRISKMALKKKKKKRKKGS